MIFSDPPIANTCLACHVCPLACRLAEGQIGVCKARQAQGGTIVSLNYGRAAALALDPIEKKPLANFHPHTTILSYGSFGCNLKCTFCQNWEIAHGNEGVRGAFSLTSLEGVRGNACLTPSFPWVDTQELSPRLLVEQAASLKDKNCLGVALTYNEPLVCPEYVVDVARIAHEHDLKLAIVTNGYVMPAIAEHVFSVVDAANIDLKAFNQDFYTMVGAPHGLAVVKRSIEIALAKGCHVEVTTLVISGLNDSPEEMAQEAAWLASLSPEIPLHISRFSPAYKMTNKPPTPRDTIIKLEAIAREHLTHVYKGNV